MRELKDFILRSENEPREERRSYAPTDVCSETDHLRTSHRLYGWGNDMGSFNRDSLLHRDACLRTFRALVEGLDNKLATHRQRDHNLLALCSTPAFQQLCECYDAQLTRLCPDCHILRFCRLQHDHHRYLLTSHHKDVHTQSILAVSSQDNQVSGA